MPARASRPTARRPAYPARGEAARRTPRQPAAAAPLAALHGGGAAARRFAAPLLLAVLLVLAQFGAHVHAIGHAAAASQDHATPADADGKDGDGGHTASCIECLALGGIGFALAAHAGGVPLVAAAFDRPAPPAAAAAATAALRPRCRAPPAPG